MVKIGLIYQRNDMEKHYIEVPQWIHKQVEIWNNHKPWVRQMTKVGYVWLIIYLFTHIKIIILK